MPGQGRTGQAFENPQLNFQRSPRPPASRHGLPEPVKPIGKGRRILPRQTGDQIRVNNGVCCFPQKFQNRKFLSGIAGPPGQRRNSGVEGLDAQFQAQAPRGEAAHQRPKFRRKPGGDHLEVDAEGRCVCFDFIQSIQKEFHDPAGPAYVQIERPVQELDCPRPPLQQGFHAGQKFIQGEFPYLSVQRTQAEITAEGAASGGFHIDQLTA